MKYFRSRGIGLKRHVTEYTLAKTAEYPLQNQAFWKKYLNKNEHNGLHMARK